MKNIYVAISEKSKIPIPDTLTIERVTKTVSNYYSLNASDIMMRDRHKEMVVARQMAWYIIRFHCTGMRVIDIANWGRFHHTTVCHGVTAIGDRMKNEPDLLRNYNELKQILNLEQK